MAAVGKSTVLDQIEPGQIRRGRLLRTHVNNRADIIASKNAIAGKSAMVDPVALGMAAKGRPSPHGTGPHLVEGAMSNDVVGAALDVQETVQVKKADALDCNIGLTCKCDGGSRIRDRHSIVAEIAIGDALARQACRTGAD